MDFIHNSGKILVQIIKFSFKCFIVFPGRTVGLNLSVDAQFRSGLPVLFLRHPPLQQIVSTRIDKGHVHNHIGLKTRYWCSYSEAGSIFELEKQQPKTKAGIRDIPVIDQIYDVLKAEYKAQQEKLRKKTENPLSSLISVATFFAIRFAHGFAKMKRISR